MIDLNKVFEASSNALNAGCGDEHRCPEFIEEWIPQLVTEIEILRKEVGVLKATNNFLEVQLLELEAKVEELQ